MEPILRAKVKIFFKSDNLKKKCFKLTKNDGQIDKKIWGGCCHLLLVYDASKLSTVYVVKWPVLGLQRANENSEFTPSV